MKVCLSIAERNKEFDMLYDELSKYAEVDIVGLNNFSLKDYDIFIGKLLPLSILETADKLKCIFAYKTGVDDFPLQELKKRNITLVNSHADSRIIAEYAFCLAISLVNRVTEFDRQLRNNIWYDNDNMYWKSIFSMNVGLLGFGHIGKELNSILTQNNIKTYTVNRGKSYSNINLVDTVDELINVSDILICSLPKTPETNNIFNETNLKNMKGKYIVNVGRSNCIDQEALFKALKNETLSGAAIDTWDKKPKDFYSTLKPSKYDFNELDNIILSPHAAMRVENGHYQYVMDTLRNVLDFINNKEIKNIVDLNKGY